MKNKRPRCAELVFSGETRALLVLHVAKFDERNGTFVQIKLTVSYTVYLKATKTLLQKLLFYQPEVNARCRSTVRS